MADELKEGSGNPAAAPDEQRTSSVIVPFRREGAKRPLFLIHGVDGDVNYFPTLVRYLEPDRPIYGIRAQSLQGERHALTRIEAMASYYLKEIRRVQPDGPCYFLGFSFGGFVAFEMAQQLHSRGQMPGMVAMLDTRTMGTNSQPIDKIVEQKRKRFVSHLRRLTSSQAGAHAAKVLRASFLRITYTLLDKLGKPIPRFLQRPFDINWFAAVRYTPRPFPGRIILFETAETVSDVRSSRDVWNRLAGSVEIREVPGDHEELLKEPNVQRLAWEITQCLAREDRCLD